MKKLTIDSAVSLNDLKEGVYFSSTGYAHVECTVEETAAHIAISCDFSWGRDDIKELIQFLKAVRKLIPKESE